MSRFLMWMMICLLPLRLWAGDAMAVQHTPPASEAAMVLSQPAAHPCHGVDAAGAADAAVADLSVHDTQHPISQTAVSEHAGVCGDCSVCHGPLAGLATPTWTAPPLVGALPQALGWSALSASALPQLKPPRV